VPHTCTFSGSSNDSIALRIACPSMKQRRPDGTGYCTTLTAKGITRNGQRHTVASLPAAEFDALLHDPPRFGIAGELYSQTFYDHLARVLRRGGRLFHYTGSPNKLTTGRDVPREVAKRLEKSGFKAELALDGVFAVKR